MHNIREMEVINNGLGENQTGGYDRLERWDEKTTAALTEHYREILKHLGEDGAREGLKETPARVAKAMQFLTQGYGTDPADILRTAMFHEDYSEMATDLEARMRIRELGDAAALLFVEAREGTRKVSSGRARFMLEEVRP